MDVKVKSTKERMNARQEVRKKEAMLCVSRIRSKAAEISEISNSVKS